LWHRKFVDGLCIKLTLHQILWTNSCRIRPDHSDTFWNAPDIPETGYFLPPWVWQLSTGHSGKENWLHTHEQSKFSPLLSQNV
ncbi:hypothetical protein, partial [Acetobacter malorum]|uniref:hypothetical protein n=1 Tax=Acetobacter malorum TaxID=178901 RepID=UPI001E5CBBAB